MEEDEEILEESGEPKTIEELWKLYGPEWQGIDPDDDDQDYEPTDD